MGGPRRILSANHSFNGDGDYDERWLDWRDGDFPVWLFVAVWRTIWLWGSCRNLLVCDVHHSDACWRQF